MNQSASWLSPVQSLPIVEHLESISAVVRDNPLTVLEAPPGSGKTTILPIYLARLPLLNGRKVIVLQPRRLAAKTVASRMAELLGEHVGESVGYQIRLERRTSGRTTVEVLTEGLLTKRVINDPDLRDVGLVIFDEFHERSIHADTGLALMREVLSVLRPDLRVLVMSATLGDLADHAFFAGAGRYKISAKPFPLSIYHIAPEPRVPLWQQTANAIKAALDQHPGDLLAFLPGRYDIDRCRERLSTPPYPRDVTPEDIFPLYGDLPYQQQKRAISPSLNGNRKVVLATTIAETSLTIEGVRIVVDSGYHKVSRSSVTGSSALREERISRDSADQRAGRAARTAPGVCVRLWTQQDHFTLPAAREPEILRSDIAQPLLLLAAWGVREPEKFPWLTSPTPKAMADARQCLLQLGAIDSDGSITPRGKLLFELGTHPRLATICVMGRQLRQSELAASIVALLEERDDYRGSARGADLRPRLTSLLSDRDIAARSRQLRDAWRERIDRLPDSDGANVCLSEEDAVGFLVATAFPEQIARRREPDGYRYLLASGVGASLAPSDPLRMAEFIVITDVQERLDGAMIHAAFPLNPALFDTALAHLVSTQTTQSFDSGRALLNAYTSERIGAITLRERPVTTLSQEARHEALCQFLATPEGFVRLPFPESFSALQNRCAWVRSLDRASQIPDISAENLRATIGTWFLPLLPRDCRLDSLTTAFVQSALGGILTWSVLRDLDAQAPEVFTLPNGKPRRINYHPTEGPLLEATIQELFTLEDTPRLGSRRHPLTLHLLSPARRPMQVTKDLKSFWKNGYPLVRKELRGRYPKHKWPEDPIRGV